MRIAVIGGGKRCLQLMNIIDSYDFQIVTPVVAAVSDLNTSAAGFMEAQKKGLFVTRDYNDFFPMDSIDLMVELTGDLNVYNDILLKKKHDVMAIAHTTALLFREISRASALYNKTQKKLNISHKMYDIMLNGLIQEDVIVIAMDYKILDINDSFLETLGLSREEVIGHYCYEITHHQNQPCSGEEHPCPLAQVCKTGKSSSSTHIHLDKNKNKLHFSISCYPFVENGEVVGVIEVSKNISSEIQRQKAMMQQEKLVSIGRLSAGVAHEINNPLTTILTSSMLAQEDLDKDSELFHELEIISKEALRCRKIVKSLLDFARQSKPLRRPGDINEIVLESSVLTKKQAAFNNINLAISLDENLPLTQIDSDQIQQTIINLVLNAIEAAESGDKISIATFFNKPENKIKITVSDTGSGISPQTLDNIFDPFFTTKDTGTGLGLAITHGIIEQHGGTITVNSALGKGTDFIIELPMDRDDAHVR